MSEGTDSRRTKLSLLPETVGFTRLSEPVSWLFLNMASNMATIQLKRGYGPPTSLQPGEPAMDLLNGRLYIGGEKGEVIPIGSDNSLLGSGILFWIRVVLGVLTAWILLQIFNHVGDAFLLRRASNLLGDSQPVGGFSAVIPVAQIALVKAVEALAALGTVVVIAMRAIVTSGVRYLVVLLAGAPAKKGFQLLDMFRRKPAQPATNPTSLAELLRQLQTTNAPPTPLADVQQYAPIVQQPVQPVQQPVPTVVQATAPLPTPPSA